jgi:hypothetical protein
LGKKWREDLGYMDGRGENHVRESSGRKSIGREEVRIYERERVRKYDGT